MREQYVRGVTVKAKHHTPEALSAGVVRALGAETGEASGVGVYSIPKRRKRWTVNRSPHGNKTAREQFVMELHGRGVQGWRVGGASYGMSECVRALHPVAMRVLTDTQGATVQRVVRGGYVA